MGSAHVLSVDVLSPIVGPDGPPRNSVTAIAHIVIRFMNSARKKIANRMPVYSVWNPPTSSCSASTRSNGGWFVSASAEIRKTMNAPMAGTQYHWETNESQSFQTCACAIPRVESVPACTMTPTIESPSAASYESSCADARTEPSSGYFDPDDHPASSTPYKPMPDMASSQSTPKGGSKSCSSVRCPKILTVGPIGTIANARNAGTIER